jgi:hypothetical protein
MLSRSNRAQAMQYVRVTVHTCLSAPSALSALSACLLASSTFSAAKLRWTVASMAERLRRSMSYYVSQYSAVIELNETVREKAKWSPQRRCSGGEMGGKREGEWGERERERETVERERERERERVGRERERERCGTPCSLHSLL